jgi:hypothetical protein
MNNRNQAQNLKALHSDDTNALLVEADRVAEVTQDYDNEATEFVFPDSSVLIVRSYPYQASAYGSQAQR